MCNVVLVVSTGEYLGKLTASNFWNLESLRELLGIMSLFIIYKKRGTVIAACESFQEQHFVIWDEIAYLT